MKQIEILYCKSYNEIEDLQTRVNARAAELKNGVISIDFFATEQALYCQIKYFKQ